MRKITHGNPIADRTNIASIYFSSFFLFVNIKPLNKVDSATNNPRQYIGNERQAGLTNLTAIQLVNPIFQLLV